MINPNYHDFNKMMKKQSQEKSNFKIQMNEEKNFNQQQQLDAPIVQIEKVLLEREQVDLNRVSIFDEPNEDDQNDEGECYYCTKKIYFISLIEDDKFNRTFKD